MPERDIPALLFRSGSHPLLDGQGRQSLGGRVPSQRGECSRSRPWLGPGQKAYAGPLRARPGVTDSLNLLTFSSWVDLGPRAAADSNWGRGEEAIV